MASATVNSAKETNAYRAVPAPTLAPTPVGLSARRAERWLCLPPGAWQKRRLYALKVGGETFESLGIRIGDFLIVEPGARERPGQTVVTKNSSILSIRRIPLPSPSNQIPSVLELPLRQRTAKSPARVIGTVIGVIRPTGSGALKPVLTAARPSARRTRRDPDVVSSRQSPGERPSRRDPRSDDARSASLRRFLTESWPLAGSIAGDGLGAQGDASERWRLRLSALLRCEQQATDPRIRGALLDEAAGVALLAARHVRRRELFSPAR